MTQDDINKQVQETFDAIQSFTSDNDYWTIADNVDPNNICISTLSNENDCNIVWNQEYALHWEGDQSIALGDAVDELGYSIDLADYGRNIDPNAPKCSVCKQPMSHSQNFPEDYPDDKKLCCNCLDQLERLIALQEKFKNYMKKVDVYGVRD